MNIKNILSKTVACLLILIALSMNSSFSQHHREMTPEEVNIEVKEQIERLSFLNPDSSFDAVMRLEGAAMMHGKAASPAIEPLYKLYLKSDNPQLQARIVRALGYTKDVQALKPLLEIIHNKNPEIRALAVEGIAQIHDASALPTLISASNDANAFVRQQACRALGFFYTDPVIIEPLATRLKDQDKNVVKMAASILVKLKDPRVARYFVDMLKTGDEFSRLLANSALFELTGKDLGNDPAAWTKWINETRETDRPLRNPSGESEMAIKIKIEIKRLALSDPQERKQAAKSLYYYAEKQPNLEEIRELALTKLIQVLNTESDAETKLEVLEIFKLLKDPKTTESIIAVINDNSESVQYRAIDTLALIGDKRAVDPLLKKLKSDEKNAYIPGHIMQALLSLKDTRCIPVIITMLNKDPLTTKEATNALVGFGTDAQEELNQALKNEDINIHCGAALVLAKLKAPNAIEALVDALKGISNYKEISWQRADLLSALGQTKDPRVVKALIEALSYPPAYIRAGAAHALGEICDPSSVEALTNALNDTDYGVKSNASLALINIKEHTAPPVDQSQPNLEQIKEIITQMKQTHDYTLLERLSKQLGNLINEKNIRFITEKIKTENDRKTIEWLIGSLAYKKEIATVPLIELLKETDTYRGQIIANRLSEYKSYPLKDPELKPQITKALLEFERSGNSTGQATLSLPDPEAVKMAVYQFEERGDRAPDKLAIKLSAARVRPEPLMELINDKDVKVRRRAIYSLGYLYCAPGTREIIDALVFSITSDTDDKVKEYASFTLRHIAETDHSKEENYISEKLLPIISDKNKPESTRFAAINVFAHLYSGPTSDSLIRGLETLLTDKSELVKLRVAAANVLQSVSSAEKILNTVRNDPTENKELKDAAISRREQLEDLMKKLNIDSAVQEKSKKPEVQTVDWSGFKNIKWKTKLRDLHNVMIHHAGTACGDYYNKTDDDLKIFGISVDYIRYEFRDDQFFAVVAKAEKKEFYVKKDRFLKAFNDTYGHYAKHKTIDRKDLYLWQGQDMKIVLVADEQYQSINIDIDYTPLRNACKARLGISYSPYFD